MPVVAPGLWLCPVSPRRAEIAQHDAAPVSLLAERTAWSAAAATGALPANSGNLQQLAIRQQQHEVSQHEVDAGEERLQQPSPVPSSSGGGVTQTPRRSADESGRSSSSGATVAVARGRQTEEQRQLQAVRTFGSYD